MELYSQCAEANSADCRFFLGSGCLSLPQGPSTSSGPGHNPQKPPTAGAVLLSTSHDGDRQAGPIEIRPNVSASRPAGGADHARLDVAQPEMVWPGVGADRDVMAAMAPDHDASNAGGAHLAEGDLLGSHAPSKRGSRRAANCRLVGASISDELLPVVGVD